MRIAAPEAARFGRVPGIRYRSSRATSIEGTWMTTARPTLSEQLARFVAQLDYDSIPERLRDKAKLHLLDSVGVALASSRFEFAESAFAGLRRFGAGESAVIGMRGTL